MPNRQYIIKIISLVIAICTALIAGLSVVLPLIQGGNTNWTLTTVTALTAALSAFSHAWSEHTNDQLKRSALVADIMARDDASKYDTQPGEATAQETQYRMRRDPRG